MEFGVERLPNTRLIYPMDFDKQIARRGTGSLKWDKYPEEVLPFWVADMDIESPAEVIEALHKRVDHKVYGYTNAPQTTVDAVVNYLKNTHQFEVDPEWLVWMPGLVPAINVATRAYGQPGDAVLTWTPAYFPFLSAPGFAGQQLQVVAFEFNSTTQQWEIDYEKMEAAVTPETKLFLLSNPHNPTGKVLTRDEMIGLGEFCIKHDIILCSDEIHCDLILNDKPHVCAGSLPQEILDRTIIMMSPSKTYNLAGLCCAYVIIPNDAVRLKFRNAARGIITEVNCFGYAGCEAAYTYGEGWRRNLIAYLNENLKLLDDTVASSLPGIHGYPMDATYLAWLNVEGLDMKDPAGFFEKAGVGLSDGPTFRGRGHVRLNFGCPRSQLQEGLDRMQQALKA